MLTPNVGSTYKFKFKDAFSSLNGIYAVLKIMTYDECVADQIDLLAVYTSVGKTEIDYDNDLVTLRTDKILKLQSISTSSIYYIPMFLGDGEPNVNVRKYLHMALGVDLGVFDNADQVMYIKSTLQEFLDGGLGITSEPIITEITSKQVWLTEDEYSVLEAARTTRKNSVINVYTENIKLRKLLDTANTKIANYETTIKTLSKNG